MPRGTSSSSASTSRISQNALWRYFVSVVTYWAMDMLLSGDLDAVMCPVPPKGFYAADSKMVRLIPDYRRAEQEYYRGAATVDLRLLKTEVRRLKDLAFDAIRKEERRDAGDQRRNRANQEGERAPRGGSRARYRG